MDLKRGRLEVVFHAQLEEKVTSNSVLLPGFTQKSGRWMCMRCGNHDPEQMARGACTFCKGECLYCLECLQMGKVKQCSLLAYVEENSPSFDQHAVTVMYKGELSEEQAKISEQLVDIVSQLGKEHLVWAVTGAGKTEMIFAAIQSVLERGGRVCIAAPRIDVCNELSPRLQSAFPETAQVVLHGLVEGHYERVPLTIATTHQLLRFYRAFDLLIVDEVDAFPYANSEMLHHAVNQSVKENGVRLYLTATPSKREMERIKRQTLSYSLLPARYHRHPLVVPSCSYVGNWHRAMQQHRLPSEVKKWMKEHLQKGIPFLCFVATIQQIPMVTYLFQHYFSDAQFSSVSSKEEDRVERILNMRQGKYDFLITTTILERGVTFEGIDVMVLEAHDRIFTREVLVQIAGRVGRSPQHSGGEVVFFHDGLTKAMKEAIREIRTLNEIAMKQGLLEEGS